MHLIKDKHMSDTPQNIIQSWTISGPNSGGHEFICFADGYLWFCGYANNGLVCTRVKIQDYVKENKRHRGRAAVLRWLEANKFI